MGDPKMWFLKKIGRKTFRKQMKHYQTKMPSICHVQKYKILTGGHPPLGVIGILEWGFLLFRKEEKRNMKWIQT